MDRDKSVTKYYQCVDKVARYNLLRFGNTGGRIIDTIEKRVVFRMFEDFPKEEFILEVAAGTGRFALMFAKKGFRVIALDSSFEMLRFIKQAAKDEELEVLCVQGNAFKLPFKPAAFKGIYSIRFIWHFASYNHLIEEIMGICKGYFVFDLINKKSLSLITTPVANCLVYRSLYTQLVSSKEIQAFLSKKGYCVVEKTSRLFFPYIFYRRMPFISKWLIRLDQRLLSILTEGTVLYYKIANKVTFVPGYRQSHC